jgi:hypothetical protein
MKKLLILIGVLLLCGCGKVAVQPNGSKVRYEVIVIEGCEYIRMSAGEALAHKGNCTNIIHLYRSED